MYRFQNPKKQIIKSKQSEVGVLNEVQNICLTLT